MVELAVAIVIITLAIGSATLTVGATKSMSQQNQDRARALDEIENLIEEIRGTDPNEVFLRYNTDTADDLPGDNPGSTFDVRGLTAAHDDPDGMVGEIEFPGNGFELREDDDDIEFGMGAGLTGLTGKDLNLDGVIDSGDHGDDYSVLPMRIRCVWEGSSGVQSVQVVLVVCGR